MSWSYLDKWQDFVKDVPRYLNHESPKIRRRGETILAVDKVLKAAAATAGYSNEVLSLSDAVDELHRRRTQEIGRTR